MTTRSVRVRLTAVAAAVTALVLLGTSVALVLLLQRSLLGSADETSKGRAEDLAGLAEEDRLPASLDEIGDESVAQVVGPSGEVLLASPGLSGEPLSDDRPSGDDPELLELAVPDDEGDSEPFRVWAVTADGPDGPVSVFVGSSRDDVDESVAALVVALAVALPVVLLVSTSLIWILVGRTLRPVEEAHARQRAFVADAAHELQSPLASYRTQLEVALEHPEGTDWPATARDLLAESDRMERLVRDLLFLARQDESAAPPDGLVDLDDVVLEEVRRLRAGSDIAVRTDGVSAAPVRGSREDLSRMVRNLLANAARHARSTVTVSAAADGDGVRLAVADDGPGVPPEIRDRVFERFFRGDQARAHEGGSTGLGLAIVRAIADRHGGTVSLSPDGPGATFMVRLPSA